MSARRHGSPMMRLSLKIWPSDDLGLDLNESFIDLYPFKLSVDFKRGLGLNDVDVQ